MWTALHIFWACFWNLNYIFSKPNAVVKVTVPEHTQIVDEGKEFSICVKKDIEAIQDIRIYFSFSGMYIHVHVYVTSEI